MGVEERRRAKLDVRARADEQQDCCDEGFKIKERGHVVEEVARAEMR